MLERIYKYCLAKAGATESFPFDENTLVLKVGKIFAMISLEKNPLRMNLKCDPERAVELRETYDSVLPGYHCNKQHWNTLVLDNSIPDDLVFELIDHSYDLIVASLSKKQKEALGWQ